jgi:hypothetical protein
MLRGKRPSPAMVVAVLALSLAVVGTAAAGVATISAFSHKEKRQVKKIANKQIRKKASGLSVQQAESADSLRGLAYARINGNGTLTAQSKGISQANVTKDGPGDYCISGLSPAPKGVTATLDWGAPFGAQIYARLPADLAGHCQGKQVAVTTYDSANTATDMPIYVVVF